MQTFFKTLMISTFIFLTGIVRASCEDFPKAETAPEEITSLAGSVETIEAFCPKAGHPLSAPLKPPPLLTLPSPCMKPEVSNQTQIFINLSEDFCLEEVSSTLKNGDLSSSKPTPTTISQSMYYEIGFHADEKSMPYLIAALFKTEHLGPGPLRSQCLTLATKLIEDGADLITNPTEGLIFQNGLNALDAGCFLNCFEIVRSILNRIGDENLKELESREGFLKRALHFAACNHHNKIVTFLLEKGAHVTRSHLTTALNQSAKCYEVVVTLLAENKKKHLGINVEKILSSYKPYEVVRGSRAYLRARLESQKIITDQLEVKSSKRELSKEEAIQALKRTAGNLGEIVEEDPKVVDDLFEYLDDPKNLQNPNYSVVSIIQDYRIAAQKKLVHEFSSRLFKMLRYLKEHGALFPEIVLKDILEDVLKEFTPRDDAERMILRCIGEHSSTLTDAISIDIPDGTFIDNSQYWYPRDYEKRWNDSLVDPDPKVIKELVKFSVREGFEGIYDFEEIPQSLDKSIDEAMVLTTSLEEDVEAALKQSDRQEILTHDATSPLV